MFKLEILKMVSFERLFRSCDLPVTTIETDCGGKNSEDTCVNEELQHTV
jgi:hypothetical protein